MACRWFAHAFIEFLTIITFTCVSVRGLKECEGPFAHLCEITEENMNFNNRDKMDSFEGVNKMTDNLFKNVKETGLMDIGEKSETSTVVIVVSAILTAAVVIFIVVFLFVYLWRRRKRRRKRQLSRKDSMDTEEPLSPTDAKPDLSKLKIIKESELRRGEVIGFGAFGIVYKGFWVPQGENVKIPVAIKILREGTSLYLQNELLEESRVMASVEHPSCVRLLAVCMSSQRTIMISQLMPLGCLLGYMHKHKNAIGSKTLLKWCAQIARGMAYLERRGIVHRDLAARNILVQTTDQVKITDFGLARLLGYNEDEFHGTGERVPIRWLAPECIKDRVYSHKSDVWSYGVTLWEMFTNGARPYEKERVRDVPDLIEKGERLPQPAICTIDVYMILIKCWMYDAESRPSFTELAELFFNMSRDPGRYLVIQGDKMMKLPTDLDVTDYKDLDACADGTEKLIEAEEYFRTLPPKPSQKKNQNKTFMSPAYVHIPADEDGYLQTVTPPPNVYLELQSTEGLVCSNIEENIQDDIETSFEPQTPAKNDKADLKTISETSKCNHFENDPADTRALTDEDMQRKMSFPNHLYSNIQNQDDNDKKFKPQTAATNDRDDDMSLQTKSEHSNSLHSEDRLVDSTVLEEADIRPKMTSRSYVNLENYDGKDELMALQNRAAFDSTIEDRRSRFEFKNKSTSNLGSKHERASRFESRNTTANRIETNYESAGCINSSETGYCSAPETFLADTTVLQKNVI